mgnify:CR=1 FL=1
MSQTARSSKILTERFVLEHGQSLLERFGEAPVQHAAWHISSHGAVVRVEGEHDALFERLFVVIPKPPDAPASRFKPWAEGRIEHYNWYLELTNLGRCVQSLVSDMCGIVTVMRRIGRSTADPQFSLPEPAGIFGILGRFAKHTQHYVDFLGDADLRYVNAMRVYDIPRLRGAPDRVVGLDILPTLIGLEHEAKPIHPLTLVRGIIGEFAELYDQEREVLGGAESDVPKRKRKQRALECERAVNALDGVCAKIELQRPTLELVSTWLQGIDKPPPKKQSKGSLWTTLGLIIACVLLAWHLAR